MQVFKADLENWPEIEEIYAEFLSSPFKERFDINKEGLRRYFKLSMVDNKYAIILVREAEKVVGFSVLYEIQSPDIMVGLIPQSFLHVCYINPRASKEAGDLMNQAIEMWGRSRGHNYVLGNVRATKSNPFKSRAAEKRYGFKTLYITVGKQIPEGGENNG